MTEAIRPSHTEAAPGCLPVDEQATPGVLQGIRARAEMTRTPDLERFRRGIRGNDAAVREIGSTETREELVNILENPGVHSHDELIGSMMQNYSGEVYGDVQWNKHDGGWGSPAVINDYGKLREEYPHLSPLSLDPGFMTHLPLFMDMVEAGDISTEDWASARAQLKEELGSKTVWRGMELTDEELEAVKKEGIISKLAMTTAQSKEPDSQFAASAVSAFPGHTIEGHFSNSHLTSPFISVSENKEVALAVGRHYGRPTPDKNLYVFEISLPVIDEVSYTDHAFRMPGKIRALTERNPDASVKVTIDGETTETKWTEGVENYAFWKIDPENIINITKPDVTETSFMGKVTRTPLAV